VLPALERLIDRNAALWAPVTLHWSWEADDDWEALRRRVRVLTGCAFSWERFLDAVAASR
jgi:hypothetical protein